MFVEKSIDTICIKPRIRFREVSGLAGIIRTAIIAAAPEQLQRRMLHLLAAQNIVLAAMTDNGQEALHLLSLHRPDLLVCDAQLPGMDGAALAKRAICSFHLPVRPAVLLLRFPEFPIIHAEELTQNGALFLDKPVSDADFSRAVARLQLMPPAFSAAQKHRAGELLDALGVPAHIGRDCLMHAALLCAADERCLHALGSRLYPLLARICRLEAAQAERAMRHAIGLAWQSDKFDNQYRIFADTVDAGRGQPTCSEMISRLADILRLEG